MKLSINRTLLYMIIVIIIIYINMLLSFIKSTFRNKQNIKFTNIKLSIISDSLVIFSCFYDIRYNVIRLIGVSSSIINLSCIFTANNTSDKCMYKYELFKQDSAGYNFKSVYLNIIVYLNQTNEIPKEIKINDKFYNINNNHENEKRNVLCITTIKNFNSYNLLSQSLHIYSNYGITDVYIYVSDFHLKLDIFLNIHFLIFHFIYIHNEYLLNTSFYFGQTVKYNDCLYRNMFESNYMIFADFDELILLNSMKKYNELLNAIDVGDIYYFKSSICPTTYSIEKKEFHKLHDVNIFNTYNCCLMNSYYHRKYLITSPQKFIKLNIHYVDCVYERIKHIYVNESDAHIHHSRIPTFLLLNHCVKWFNDKSLLKHKTF